MPHAALGADPAILAPFGVGRVDMRRLGEALRGDGPEGALPAERRHRVILEALNLDPRGLTMAFRWAVSAGLPGAIRVRAALEDRPVGS
jgi:hypothetical protein